MKKAQVANVFSFGVLFFFSVTGYVLEPNPEIFCDTKPFYAVIGLPRGGTTVVSSFLGSMEGSFCLCEPVWLFMKKPEIFNQSISSVTSKALDLKLTVPERFVSEIRAYLSASIFTSGGIKETYSDYRAYCADILLEKNPDMVIFVLRHPKALFHAWKTIWWGFPFNNVHFLIKNYKEMIQKRMVTHNAVDIVYEIFSQNPIKYMQNKLTPLFTISGEFTPLQQMESVQFGDDGAKEGGVVKPASLSMNSLEQWEHELIEQELMPLYEQLVKNERS